jgi:ABC-type amino acid transport substrate-binding protein
MFFIKKNFINACNFLKTLAYINLTSGVVVELVTTLACHAGGRGFKSPPSRHLFLSLLHFLFSFPAYSNENKSSNKFVIVAKENPTYSYFEKSKNNSNLDENTQYKGASFEIIKKVFDELKIEYTFAVIPKYQIEIDLKEGLADMALDIPQNEKTLKFASFMTTPTRTLDYYFFGRKEDSRGATTLTYYNVLEHNYLVGISANTLYPTEFWDVFPFEKFSINNHLEEAVSYEDNLKKLMSKHIDYFIGEKFATTEIINKINKVDEVYQYKNLLFSKKFYAAFSKNSKRVDIDDLKIKIQRLLFKMEESNQLKEINQFWISKSVHNGAIK